jgi:hypothetical protein
MDLTDLYKIFHLTAMEYTFFSTVRTFSEIDHILGHKANLDNYKKTEIISSILSDHNEINLEINSMRNCTNIWRLKNILYFLWDWGLNSGLHTAKQALYHLNHTSSLFCSGYFGDGDLMNYFPRLASNHNPPNFSL